VRGEAVKNIAVFLQGNEPLAVRILEDGIAIHLYRAGIQVFSREVVERAVGDQVAKRKKDRTEGTINALDIGKAMRADAVLTGTVLVAAEEKRAVVIWHVSFQMLEVEGGAALRSGILSYDGGATLLDVAKAIADSMKSPPVR
jgi:hypothetical protein